MQPKRYDFEIYQHFEDSGIGGDWIHDIERVEEPQGDYVLYSDWLHTQLAKNKYRRELKSFQKHHQKKVTSLTEWFYEELAKARQEAYNRGWEEAKGDNKNV